MKTNPSFTFAEYLALLERQELTPLLADEVRQLRTHIAPPRIMQRYFAEFRALARIAERYSIPPEKVFDELTVIEC